MKEKVIGILGGMGPEATLDLFRKILENTSASRDQEHARIIIDNNPKIPERLPAILGNGEDPVPMMLAGARSLAKAGADFIVIPCVSAHFFLPVLRRRVGLPILSMIDETAAVLSKHVPRLKKVGLLAARGTVHAGLFQACLVRRGIEIVSCDHRDLESVQSCIFSIKDTKGRCNRESLRRGLVKVADRCLDKGAEGMIIGCTELSLVLDQKSLPVPAFDSLTILAKAAIRKAGLKVRP